MKKLLNTIYITRQDSYLHKERETIVVKNKEEKIGQFPAINIGGVLCFGRVSVSPYLMGYCAENGIGLAFFTEYGKFLGRVQGKITGNVLLRREQYRWADNKEKSASLSRLIIASKITNGRSVLQREIRNHGDNPLLENAIKKLSWSLKRLKNTQETNEIMGVEGEAAAVYFSVFNELIRGDGFSFEKRVRRPSTDPVNAMLSFIYSIMNQECASALYGIGLDPYVGVLHRDRPGRMGLALDMLEEFRAIWGDRLVLTLLNRQQIKQNDFVTEAGGAVRFSDEGRKRFLMAYQERKQVEVIHPYLKEKVPTGLLPHCQAMLLARHIRGDTQYYTPYLVK